MGNSEQNVDRYEYGTHRAAIGDVDSIEQENSADREVVQSLDPDLDGSTRLKDNFKLKLWPMGSMEQNRRTELRL